MISWLLGSRRARSCGVDRRDHPVVVTVDNEHRLPDLGEIGRRLLAPGAQGLQLGHVGAHGDVLVTVVRALREPFQESLAGFDAAGRAGEEQELLGVLAREKASQEVQIGHPCNGADALAPSRAGASEDHFANQIGLLQGDLLGNHSAHREAEQIHLLVALGLDESDRVIGHLLHGVGWRAAGCTHASVVERDHVALGGKPVHNAGVPVVQHRRQMDQQNQRRPAVVLAQFTVGKVHPARRDGLGGRSGPGWPLWAGYRRGAPGAPRHGLLGM